MSFLFSAFIHSFAQKKSHLFFETAFFFPKSTLGFHSLRQIKKVLVHTFVFYHTLYKPSLTSMIALHINPLIWSSPSAKLPSTPSWNPSAKLPTSPFTHGMHSNMVVQHILLSLASLSSKSNCMANGAARRLLKSTSMLPSALHELFSFPSSSITQ